MAKEHQVNVRITKEEKKLLEQDAEKEGRTLSNLMLWCWKQWREAKKGKTDERRSSK